MIIRRWFAIVLIHIVFAAVTTAAGSAHAAAEENISGSLRIPDSATTQVIRLDDGTTLRGQITEIGDTEIKFRTAMGELTIPIDLIREIAESGETSILWREGWFPNPNRTRLFVAPTGRTLRAGEGYFSSLLLFFPSVVYGLTDNITIGGGFSLFPGIDISDQLFYLTPKVGLAINDYLSVAGSTMLVGIPDDDDGDEDDLIIAGVLFGMATLGTDDRSLTFGLGFGYLEDEISDDPAVLLGGEWRFAERFGLVTENWIFPGFNDPAYSYGARFFGEKMAIDLAFFDVLDGNAMFPGIPFVDFVFNF